MPSFERYSPELTTYFKEIKNFKPLTKEEEQKIGRQIKLGDRKSMQRLINSNLKYVVTVAKRYRGNGISLPDLIAEGNIGLIKAAEKYDYKSDNKFFTYAKWWIQLYIQESLRTKVGKEEYVGLEYRDLTNIDPEDIIYHGHYESSLDKKNNLKFTNILLSKLNKRERELLTAYYGLGEYEPMNLEEIGEKFKISKERVRQINEKSVRKLRSFILLNSELTNIYI